MKTIGTGKIKIIAETENGITDEIPIEVYSNFVGYLVGGIAGAGGTVAIIAGVLFLIRKRKNMQ